MPPTGVDGIRARSWSDRLSPRRSQRSAVVRKGERDVEVGGLQHALDGLEVVSRLARDAQLVALDLALDALGTLVTDELVDLLGVLLRDALLERRVEVVLLAGDARAGLGDVEVLEADLALDEVGLHDVEDRLAALLGAGLHLDDLAGELDGGADVLEVVAGRDLLAGAVDRVRDLLLVELADDVEGGVGHRGGPSGCCCLVCRAGALRRSGHDESVAGGPISDRARSLAILPDAPRQVVRA